MSFDGQAFARSITRDRKMLPLLFGEQNAQAMTDLAGVLNTASPTMRAKESQLVGILIGVEQARGVFSGLQKMVTGGVAGLVSGAAHITGLTLVPRAFAGILADPSGLPGQILVNAVKHGVYNQGTVDSIVRALTRAEAVASNPPASALAPGEANPPGLPPITVVPGGQP